MHARRGAESLLSDCSVMRWLPYHSAAANTVARRVGELMALRGCKRSSRQEVLTMRPRASDTARGSMRESAAACDYLAAADEGVPSQGIGGRTPCRVASKSPHTSMCSRSKAQRSSLQDLARGPHTRVSYVALAITANGGVSEVQPNDPICQTTNNNDDALLTGNLASQINPTVV